MLSSPNRVFLQSLIDIDNWPPGLCPYQLCGNEASRASRMRSERCPARKTCPDIQCQVRQAWSQDPTVKPDPITLKCGVM